MRIVRLQSDQARAPENPEYFSGTVRQQRLNPTKEPGGIDLVAVLLRAWGADATTYSRDRPGPPCR